MRPDREPPRCWNRQPRRRSTFLYKPHGHGSGTDDLLGRALLAKGGGLRAATALIPMCGWCALLTERRRPPTKSRTRRSLPRSTATREEQRRRREDGFLAPRVSVPLDKRASNVWPLSFSLLVKPPSIPAIDLHPNDSHAQTPRTARPGSTGAARVPVNRGRLLQEARDPGPVRGSGARRSRASPTNYSRCPRRR